MATSTKRTLYLPDDLWDRVKMAAARDGVEAGEPINLSEWIRVTLEAALDRRDATPRDAAHTTERKD